MCSGCSGDYAGGFDSDDFEEPIDDTRNNARLAGFSRTNPALQSNWGETSLAERRDGGPSGMELREGAWEACEILVTDTQIVEIRVIAATANSQGNSARDQLRKIRAALESQMPAKHSSAKSAKYYQTCHASTNAPEYADRFLAISRSLAQFLPRCFAGAYRARWEKWIRQTRRLIGDV